MSLRDTLTRRPASLVIVPIACAVLGGFGGCASPGPPRPPSLQLPEPVANLSAERVGDAVDLHWTTSGKTTDGLAVKGPVTAEICRATGSPSSNPDCIPVRRVLVHPGPSEATERLPTPLATGPPTLLTYRVQLKNTGEHSAGPSNPALTAAGSPPPPVADLRARASAQGALLRWRPQDAADAIELNRRHVDIPGPPMPTPPLGKGTVREASERNLRVRSTALPNSPFRLDAGGTLDQGARRGETYTYRAQRIRSIVVAGRTLELRSSPSDPVTLVMRDVFPPSPPEGLEAIVNAAGAAASIDLSWQPGTEADLAGYHVYRQEGTGPPTSLTPAPVQVPGFRDTAVVAGHRYHYTVTAVDAAGNESAASSPASEELRQP